MNVTPKDVPKEEDCNHELEKLKFQQIISNFNEMSNLLILFQANLFKSDFPQFQGNLFFPPKKYSDTFMNFVNN